MTNPSTSGSICRKLSGAQYGHNETEVGARMAPLLASSKKRLFRLGNNCGGQLVHTTLYTLIGTYSCI